MSDQTLQLIQDRIEIEELMHLYAEMVDQREWAQEF